MNEYNIEGLAELQAALQAFPVKIEKNILRGALRAGAQKIREEAQRLVPVKSGALKRSIRVSTNAQGAVAKSTLRAGDAKAFYAHMVEFGTAPHKITARKAKVLAIGVASVNHPGSKPKPFMRPAMDSRAQAAAEAAGDYLRERIPLEAVKISR